MPAEPAVSGDGASAAAGRAPETWWPVTRGARIASNRDAHARRRHPACRARRTDRDPRRVGGPPPRPRRRDLHRPARPLRLGPGRVPRGRDGPGGDDAQDTAGSAPAAGGVLRAGRRRGRRPPRGQREPGAAHRCRRDHRHRADGAVGVGAAAVPGRRVQRGRRGDPAAVPLPGPAPVRPGRGPAPAQRGQPDRPRGAARARLRRGRDAHAHPLHAGGRPRLPRARPPASPAPGTRCRRARSCSSSC